MTSQYQLRAHLIRFQIAVNHEDNAAAGPGVVEQRHPRELHSCVVPSVAADLVQQCTGPSIKHYSVVLASKQM